MKNHIIALARVVRYAKGDASDPIDEFSAEYDEMMRRARLASAVRVHMKHMRIAFANVQWTSRSSRPLVTASTTTNPFAASPPQ